MDRFGSLHLICCYVCRQAAYNPTEIGLKAMCPTCLPELKRNYTIAINKGYNEGVSDYIEMMRVTHVLTCE